MNKTAEDYLREAKEHSEDAGAYTVNQEINKRLDEIKDIYLSTHNIVKELCNEYGNMIIIEAQEIKQKEEYTYYIVFENTLFKVDFLIDNGDFQVNVNSIDDLSTVPVALLTKFQDVINGKCKKKYNLDGETERTVNMKNKMSKYKNKKGEDMFDDDIEINYIYFADKQYYNKYFPHIDYEEEFFAFQIFARFIDIYLGDMKCQIYESNALKLKQAGVNLYHIN